MDIDDLIQSYRKYLQASIQHREIVSFSSQLSDIFRQQINEHKAKEAAYIEQQLIARGAEVAKLKSTR